MSAAPSNLSANATILALELDEEGAFVILKEGTGEDLQVTAPGFAYMLQGGSDASNTDPDASEPAEGSELMIFPPHLSEQLASRVMTPNPNSENS